MAIDYSNCKIIIIIIKKNDKGKTKVEKAKGWHCTTPVP